MLTLMLTITLILSPKTDPNPIATPNTDPNPNANPKTDLTLNPIANPNPKP